MLNYIQDAQGLLVLISGHTAMLSEKYGEEDFLPIKNNLIMIVDILNDASEFLHKGQDKSPLPHNKTAYNIPENNFITYAPNEFIRQMEFMTETMGYFYNFAIQNEVFSYTPTQKNFEINFNVELVFQVLDKTLENSVKAKSTKVIVRMLEVPGYAVCEIIDNGKIDSQSNPHSSDKGSMVKNMQQLGGKVEWNARLDSSGTVVRLYFPKKPIII